MHRHTHAPRLRLSRLLLCSGLLGLSVTSLWAQPIADPTLTVTGALVDERGASTAGVEVVLRPQPSAYELDRDLLGQPDALPEAVDRIRSDAGGTFSLSTPVPGPFRLEIRPETPADATGVAMPMVYGYLSAFSAPLFLQPNELPDRHPVAVRVLDADNQPIEAALVVATPTSQRSARYERSASNEPPPQRLYPRFLRAAAKTDAEGIARFLMPTAEVNAVVSRPGFVAATAKTEAGRAALRLERDPGLRFRVRGPEGRPAPGVVIRTRGEVFVPLAETNEDGEALVSPFVDPGVTFELERADRAFARVSRPAPTTRDPSTGEQVVDVRLEPPLRVYGRVVDADSSVPVAGATVLISGTPGHATSSDQAGAFELNTSPFRTEVRLWATAYGYASAQVNAGPTGQAGPTDVTIGLKPAAPLFGLVRDASGQPVARAGLSAQLADDQLAIARRSYRALQATSAYDGSFRFPDALYDSPYRITVRAQGFASAAVDVPPLTPDVAAEPVWIVLTRGRHTVGRIVDTDDNPVAGAEVRLRWPPSSETVLFFDQLDATKPTTTDERGEFRFPAVRAGEYEVRAVHNEFLAPGNARTDVPEGEGDFDLGSFTLIPGAEIHGVVTDPNGDGVADATIQVSRYGPDRDQERTATTDIDGAFRLGGLAHEPVDLNVSADGYAPLALRPARPGTGEPILIELKAGASLAGRVVDDTGKPVARAEVQVEPDMETLIRAGVGAARDYYKRTDGDGRFRFGHLNAGTWSLEATEGASVANLDHIELAQGSEHEVELRLRSQDQLTVIVSTQLGEAVADARIRVEPEGDPRSGAYGTTDAGGRAQIGVTPGAATVSIQHPEQQNESRDIVLEPGNNELAIQLQSGGAIGGVVRSADGGPLSQATVWAFATDRVDGPAFVRRYARPAAQTTSDRNGQFRLTGLEPNAYFIGAGATGFAENGPAQAIEIDGNTVSGIDIVLTPGGSIAGAVVGLRTAELSQVGITATQNALWDTAKPDAEGNFALENLAPGTWNVVASTGDDFTGRTVERTVTLGPGSSSAFVELPFERGIRLSGQVLVAGEPMIGGFLDLAPQDEDEYQSTRTDHRGAFEMDGLEPGSYTLTIQALGGRSENRSIDLQGDLEGLRIDLEVPGTLTGVVLDAATGRPLAGAYLAAGNAAQIAVLRNEDADRVRLAGRSDSTGGGRFRIQFGPGAEQLWVTRDGYQGALLPLSVPPGQHHQGLVIELQPDPSGAPNP